MVPKQIQVEATSFRQEIFLHRLRDCSNSPNMIRSQAHGRVHDFTPRLGDIRAQVSNVPGQTVSRRRAKCRGETAVEHARRHKRVRVWPGAPECRYLRNRIANHYNLYRPPRCSRVVLK